MRKRDRVSRSAIAAAVVALALAEGAGAAVTRLDRHGTVVMDGRKIFPIVLAKGPPADGFAEVRAAGVNFLKVGPAKGWTKADLAQTVADNRAAAAKGLHTWVNLSSFAQTRPGGRRESLLRHVVGALEADASAAAIGMWKGADEPWKFRMRPASLRFAYCLSTGRRRAWCAGRPPVDRDRLWVTVQAPRAGVWSLAPYAEVTDVHGVNSYPIAIGDPDPDLGEPGSWTNVLRLATPRRSVWTTLQICWTWSYDAFGGVVLPTREQQRFMIYDAILNGARALAFYGGQNPKCWGQLDAAGGWNWTYWERVLEPLVREIGAASPLAPALVNAGSTRVLETSDPTVQAISRRGRNGEFWVLAARRGGDDAAEVAISGLPSSATRAEVYTESRSVAAAGSSLTDTFDRWSVHVYRLRSAFAASK
jgi:hypothetical protein